MAEALQGLNHLLKAPSRSAINSIFVAMFDKRSEGLSDAEERQIAAALSLSPDELAQLLAGIRLLLRVALKKNVTAADLVAALPDSVDKRLAELLGKIVGAHIDEWREARARDRAAGAQSPEPARPQSSSPQPADASARPASAAHTRSPEPARPSEQQPHPTSPRAKPAQQQQQPEQRVVAEAAAQQQQPQQQERQRVVAEAVAQQQQQQPQQQRQRQQQGQKRAAGQGLVQPSLPRLEGLDWRVDIRSASDAVARMAAPTVLVQMRVQGEEERQRLVTFELSKESLTTMLDGLKFVRDQLDGIAH
eukprot:m51a1_g7461 hypothetical protein (306) ;mRNA; r:149423-150508